jgi:transposase
MDIHSDSHRISRLEIVETGRRRRLSDEAKLQIVEESYSAARLASATARRHGISNKLLFAWRKAYREGRLGGEPVNGFVPAVLVADEPALLQPNGAGGRMEVVSANGRRIVVGADFDAHALRRLLDVVERGAVCRSFGQGR